jgi:hypothetical protein
MSDKKDNLEKENKRLIALIEPDLMEHHYYVKELREENTRLRKALEEMALGAHPNIAKQALGEDNG